MRGIRDEKIPGGCPLAPFSGKLESLICSRADSDVMSLFIRQIAAEFKDGSVALSMDKASFTYSE